MKMEDVKMRAATRWYNSKKGFGIVKTKDNREFFVHFTSIVMDGYRYLEKDDIVSFEFGAGNNGREQAVNVTPILTMKMIKGSLKEENLYVKTMKDAYKMTKYLVVDENNVIQTYEQGMDFLNLAAYAGFDTEGL